MKLALGHLAPLLMNKMIDRQAQEDDDPDEYTLKMAAQICLTMVAAIA